MNYEEDYMEGYRASIDAMRGSHGYVEMDALCWEVFSTPDGKKLLDIFKNKFIYQANHAKMDESYPISCVYMEGQRSAFRYLVELVNSYQARKDHEAKELQSNKGDT